MNNRICDNCNHFYMHPSGVSERCTIVNKGPFIVVTKKYAGKRIEGLIHNCVGFIVLTDKKPLTKNNN